MKILFVAEHLTYGGAARRFFDLAKEMSERGHEVTIFLYNGKIDFKYEKNSNLEIVMERCQLKLDNWFFRNIFYRVYCIFKLIFFLNKSTYDIVISFNDMVNINLLLCKFFTKVKIVISERSDPYFNRGYLKIIKKILFKRADIIVFQTNGAKNFFSSKISKKSIIIPNPIPDINRFNVKRSVVEKKIIVSVARLWLYQKRQDILIKAFKDIIEEYPDYKLFLFGDGPDKTILKNLINKLNLEEKVILKGVKLDILNEIKDAKMLVLTSDFEGIPNALIEGMAIGLPVISTDCSPGGARFLIKNNENGILVPRGDYKAVSNAMKYLIKEEEACKRLGNNAKEIKEILNKKKIYDSWEKMFQSISKVVIDYDR